MNRILIMLGMVFCIMQGHAQNHQQRNSQSAFDKFLKSVSEEFDDFTKQNENDFKAFRQKIMQEFIAFVSEPWKEFDEKPLVPAPKDDQVPPVVMPKDDQDKPREDNPVVIDTIIVPQPIEPQPQPVVPIEEVPVVEIKLVNFSFFGTPAKVRFDINDKIDLQGIDEESVVKALRDIKMDAYDNMILDCLAIRDKLNLCDWAYINMLKALAEHICGKGTNASTLTLAYLYMLSGYKMRLASDGNRLYMLYACKHQIFDQGYYEMDGDYYYGLEKMPSRLSICEATFPKEKQLSLLITSPQSFAMSESDARTVASEKYKDVSMTFKVNKNLIDFFGTYPASMLGEEFATKWAMYANTPLDDYVKKQVYPSLKKQMEESSQLERVSRLLNLVQTGFVYEYDDKVWGYDRSFFAEESLYYPYCDCEDRSILFTRLVRDIVGLDCILVFYPGHLAAAVNFTDEVSGDYIMLDGKKYVVSDPTYIGAPVGCTMPDMDNKTATVILLK